MSQRDTSAWVAVRRGHADLSRTSGGCLAGMERRDRREGGETGSTRLRPWAFVEPRDNAVDIDGSGGRDVLQVRFREPPIPRAAEPKSAYPLGERAFDARAAGILPLALFTRMPGRGGLQGLALWLRVEFDGAGLRRLRMRTARALRTSPAVLRAEAHLDQGMVRR